MKAWGSIERVNQCRKSILLKTIIQLLEHLLAMARKELTIMVRYPVNFIASFGQVFLIVAIFTLAGQMFYTHSAGVAAQTQRQQPFRAGCIRVHPVTCS